MKAPIDLDNLPKDRRDFLEIFGNQWGTRKHGAERLTAQEKQGLLDALNPFSNRAEAAAPAREA